MRQPPDDIGRIGHDPEAFEEFYRRHVGEVTRFVSRRVNDPYLVADLTANVFLEAIGSAGRYRGSHGGPATWLFGIARNVIATEFRRAAREQRTSDRAAGQRFLDGDDIARLEEQIDAARQARQLYVVIADLSDAERAVLELVAIDGLTVGQAADALGIRTATARVRLHRARKAVAGAVPDGLSPDAAELGQQRPSPLARAVSVPTGSENGITIMEGQS